MLATRILGLLSFILFCAQPSSASIEKAVFVPQQKVAGFNINTDAPVSVETGSKKGLVVIFMSAKCPCSRSHMAEIKDLAKNYPDFAFVGVHSNTDEDKAATQSFFKAAQFPFPVIQDPGARLANEFRASKTPDAHVVLSSGQTVYRGGVTSSHNPLEAEHKYLREALAELRLNRPVKISESRTLGCAISRAGNADNW